MNNKNLKEMHAKNIMCSVYLHHLTEISLHFKVMADGKPENDEIHERYNEFMFDLMDLIEQYSDDSDFNDDLIKNFGKN